MLRWVSTLTAVVGVVVLFDLARAVQIFHGRVFENRLISLSCVPTGLGVQTAREDSKGNLRICDAVVVLMALVWRMERL